MVKLPVHLPVPDSVTSTSLRFVKEPTIRETLSTVAYWALSNTWTVTSTWSPTSYSLSPYVITMWYPSLSTARAAGDRMTASIMTPASIALSLM